MNKHSGFFEENCLCFNFADKCKIRFKRLTQEHRKELFLAKIAFDNFVKFKGKDREKSMLEYKKYEDFYFKPWRTEFYDFDVDIELVD